MASLRRHRHPDLGRYRGQPAVGGCRGPSKGIAGPEIRIANYLSLNHPFSVDSYLADTVSGAKACVVRLLGGSGYWSYGVQELRALAESGGPPVAFLAGDGKPDPELDYLSTVPTSDCHRLASYLDAGGRKTLPPSSGAA